MISLGSEADTDRAVSAAKAAFPGWAATTPLSRARVMFRFKALLEQRADDIVAVVSREHGKVLSDAAGELARGIEIVEYACGAPQLLKSEYTDNVGTGVDAYTLRQPLGVEENIPRANIKTLTAGEHSLMPAGLEATMKPQDLADLLAFLKGTRWGA